jgi:uridine kinase
MKPYVIGICGGSGSGKTTLLKKLKNTLGPQRVSVFTMDNYYLPKESQQKDKKGVVNFDLPTALDEKLLSEDLKKLISGQPIEVKEYFFNAPVNTNKTVIIEPRDILVVEGLFLFYFEEVKKSLDFSIYINVDPKHQLSRRIMRDEKTRGYSKDAIRYQWSEHVLPCFEKYILPFEPCADFVFNNDDRSKEEFKKLIKALESKA